MQVPTFTTSAISTQSAAEWQEVQPRRCTSLTTCSAAHSAIERAFVIMIRHWGITEVLIANKLMVDLAAALRPLLQTSVRDMSCICVSRDAATPMQRT